MRALALLSGVRKRDLSGESRIREGAGHIQRNFAVLQLQKSLSDMGMQHVAESGELFYGVFSSLIFGFHSVIQLIDERKRNDHQQLPTTTAVKHLLFSFTFASSIFSPAISAASLCVIIILFAAWTALKRNHEDVKSKQPTALERKVDELYILVKSRLVEDRLHFQGESPRQQEVSDEEGSRRGLDAAVSGLGDAEERDERVVWQGGSQTDPTAADSFREHVSVAGEEPEVDCSRDVMRELHAQDMGRIFQKVARRLVSRKPIFRFLRPADVDRVIADHVSRTKVLANQWMRLWQQGAHQQLSLSDTWRLLLDVQEQTLQNRLLTLLPRQ